ncbi:MAG: HlyD family secretion protein [Rubritalea sp.]|jgi:HlyD family secretion protein
MMILPKDNKKALWIGLVIAVIGCFIAYQFLISTETASDEKFAYYTVKKSDLNISVTEGGVLKAVEEKIVKNRLNGQSLIISIVPEGSLVKAGQLLVELDPAEAMKQLQAIQLSVETSRSSFITAKNDLLIEKSTLESEQREAQQSIEFAQMDLAKFEQLDKQQQLREAESKITSEEESLRLTQDKFQWSEKLAKKGFETKSQVDRDRLELSNRQKLLDSAKSKLKMLEQFDLPKRQVELNSIVAEAQKKYERLIKQGESRMSRSNAQLGEAQRKLKLNEDRLLEDQQQLKHTKLYAPADGIALYPPRSSRQEPSVSEGANVNKNRKLITIPNLKKMKVEVKIPEFHISKIKRGQLAYITIASISDKRYKGVVSKVNPLPDRNNSWFGAAEQFYSTEITITDPLPDVKPSISAKAEIIITDLKEIFYIPLHAIRTEKAKYFCYIKDGAEHLKTEIQLGMMNNSFAEITSGVSDGDVVLLNIPEEVK